MYNTILERYKPHRLARLGHCLSVVLYIGQSNTFLVFNPGVFDNFDLYAAEKCN